MDLIELLRTCASLSEKSDPPYWLGKTIEFSVGFIGVFLGAWLAIWLTELVRLRREADERYWELNLKFESIKRHLFAFRARRGHRRAEIEPNAHELGLLARQSGTLQDYEDDIQRLLIDLFRDNHRREAPPPFRIVADWIIRNSPNFKPVRRFLSANFEKLGIEFLPKFDFILAFSDASDAWSSLLEKGQLFETEEATAKEIYDCVVKFEHAFNALIRNVVPADPYGRPTIPKASRAL